MPKKSSWGFDVKGMDTSVRPQDDFYHYANGGWMKQNPIPKAESRWGTFISLRYDTEKKLHTIVDELLKKKRAIKGTPEQMVRDFYRSGMDMKYRNSLGISPLDTWRTKIQGIETKEGLQKVMADLHTIGVGVFFGAAIDQDSKDSTKYILHVHQDGLGMPDREYYLNTDKESVRVRKAYQPYVEGLFIRMGRSKKDATQHARALIRFETELAKVSMTKEDRRDAEKTYHKKTLRDLQKLSPTIAWKRYFTAVSARTPVSVIVMQPTYIQSLSKLLRTTSLADLKTYMEWHFVNDYAPYLSHAFVKHSFSFYGTTLSGVKDMKPLWRRTLSVVNGSLGELLGQIYVKKHFSVRAKREMNRLVDDLFRAYEARIKVLDWMGPQTKAYALKKLRALTRKIGYPDTWKSYKGLVIHADDYAGNALRSTRYEHAREMRKLGKPIDRGEWFMYPQTVNAYFAPNMNDIAFPAAILQPPFFDLAADDAVNYGAIGAVIGHEISHGFDDNGAKFDAKGNLKSWWTKEDKKRFEKKAELVRKQFDEYKVADGVPVNGKLTLGENIADSGGLAIAYDAYQLKLKKTGRTTIGGFTPEQRFFLGFALFERENVRPEFVKTQVKTDPHSPGVFRINGPMSNFTAFYEAFNVHKGDRLYRAPHQRARIW